MARFVVGISGASGIILAKRAIAALAALQHDVELVMSKSAALTALEELGAEFATPEKFLNSFTEQERARITLHSINDFRAPIASGSYPADGMLVLPCSMATLAAIAVGLSDNVLRRAADVTLKERRPLVIVPREMPFSDIHLENMLKLSRMGAQIVPPIPGWYSHPKTVEDIENFIVGRILDSLKVAHSIYPRWGM